MLRMHQSRSGDAAKDYYTEALATGDYYVSAERSSPWRGRLAERLGLGPEVTRESFCRLADNLHPSKDESLTPRTKDDRTVAYDVNFHVPKGVSVLHMVSRDNRIVAAIREAVHETMVEIEKQAATRVRLGQSDGERPAGELVWGEFLHSTTRPVDGVPDPHLHVHCYVFNVTHDPVEGRLKAAHFRDIKRDMPYYEAAYWTRLAGKLETLGYRTERDGKGWDVAGVPKSVRERFSRRTAQIEKKARELNITDPNRKAEIGAATREGKEASRLQPGELRRHWMGEMTAEEREVIAAVVRDRTPRERSAETERAAAERALEHAMKHRFERESVAAWPRLLESGLRFGVGQVSPEAIRDAAEVHPQLVTAREGTQRWVTTREILQEERAMLGFARDGRGMCPPLERGMKWTRGMVNLNRQQEQAVEHVLTSRDRLMLVRGGSGTGKTTLIRTAVAAIEQRGSSVVPLAPTAEASRGAMREAGMGGAETVAKFLASRDLQAQARNGVIWVDEAGLLGTASMGKVLEVAQKQNARVILSGDTNQHNSVERGDALRLLESRLGLRSAEVTQVVRQQGTYREAVEAMGKGRFDEGIAALDRLGAIQQCEPGDWTPLVEDYVETLRTGRSCLAISPTHAEGEAISSLIRSELKSKGLLGQDERLTVRHRDLGWSQAERSDAANYQPGQIVQFHQAVRDGKSRFAPGERYRVSGRDAEGRVELTGQTGERKSLPLNRSAAFAVREELTLRVAPGERLRVTGNGKTLDGRHRLNTGAAFRVASFTPEGDLKLSNGWVVSRDFGQWDHGYVSTSHAAQGRSVDKVLIAQSWAGVTAASAEQVYVSVSRGKQAVRVYTDDREAVVEALSRLSRRRSAVELVDGPADNPGQETAVDRVKRHAQTLARVGLYETTRRELQRQRQRTVDRGRGAGRTGGRGYER
ncbi:MAG: MobF family relaxase [Phycisphaerales bacterium]